VAFPRGRQAYRRTPQVVDNVVGQIAIAIVTIVPYGRILADLGEDSLNPSSAIIGMAQHGQQLRFATEAHHAGEASYARHAVTLSHSRMETRLATFSACRAPAAWNPAPISAPGGSAVNLRPLPA